MMAADPADVSMLHVAFYLRAGGGISYLNDFAGGAQDSRVDGGAHRVCELLAERLPSGAVRLGEPVLGVHDDSRAARVRTARTAYDADAVVVAVPPRLALALDVTPAVPEPRATTRTGRGCAVKVHLVYPEPAWRRNGLSGWSVNAEGPLLSTVDDSPHHGSVGVLTGFVTGAAAHAYATLTRDEQVDAATAQAARIFPGPPRADGGARDRLARRGVLARLLRRAVRPGRLDPPRAAPHPPARARALGRHRDQHRVLRADGGRDPVRATRRSRRPPLSTRNTSRSRSQQMTVTSIAPLDVREQFMTDPDLGAGNFLDKAAAANPYRDVPFAFSHSLDHRGEVVLKGHSLVDLVRLRDRYARWYWANGVRAGEPVGIVTAEGLPPLIHFLALSALGAVPALVNDAMAPDIMVRYLDRVGVVGVVADDTTRLSIAYRSGEAPRPRFVALTSEVDAGHPHVDLPDEFPYRHAADDIVALIHSSGTTGIPKSTMLGHRQFWEGKQPRMTRFPAQPDDRLMCLMPHTHAGGLSYFLTATLLGLPVAVMGEWRRTAVEPVMEAFQPTMLASFPRTFVELATGEPPTKAAARVHSWFNTGDSAHYGHIRRLVQLGERPAGLIKPWLLPREAAEESALPGSQFIDGLGSSEMGMANFGQVTTPETERDDRCVGRPLEGVTAAVLDEDGQEVPDGTVGLLGVKTPSRTPGYWNDPRLTASFESNGWWLTGDLARRDAEGRFYHLDRTVDVIDTETGPVYSLPHRGGAARRLRRPGPATARWSACRPRRAPGPSPSCSCRQTWRTRPRRACSTAPTRSWPTPAASSSPPSSSPARPRTSRSARPARCSSASCAPSTRACLMDRAMSSLQRMIWVFPDRESTRAQAMWHPFFWDLYAEVAAELGLEWSRCAPDAITVDGLDAGKPRVFVDEQQVTPDDTLFITALYSLPYQADGHLEPALRVRRPRAARLLPPVPAPPVADRQRQGRDDAVLRRLARPADPHHPHRHGPDVSKHLYEAAIDGLTYPAIVKPASWCGGGGVNLAHSSEDLRGLVSLAQGGDTTLVAQPYLGDGTIDYRVYVVDGEPYSVMRRTPEPGSPVANASRGGDMAFPPIPPELAEATAYFAAKLPDVPFFCVDYLFDGERYWFSELEPDGVIAPDWSDPDRTLQRDITRARWTAYRNAHARFLEAAR